MLLTGVSLSDGLGGEEEAEREGREAGKTGNLGQLASTLEKTRSDKHERVQTGHPSKEDSGEKTLTVRRGERGGKFRWQSWWGE